MFPEVFRQVEHLVGDRAGDLEALKGKSWDAVIDNSGQNVQWARDSARLLADATDHYLYVSSTGVFYPYLKVGRRARVTAGPFRGIEGLIEGVARPDRLVLQIEALGRATGLEIDAGLLEPVDWS